MNELLLNDYSRNILEYIKNLSPNIKVDINTISKNPESFVNAVKRIIDLRLVEVEFSNDFKYIIRKEDVDYEKYRK